jgi:hypothetical protein
MPLPHVKQLDLISLQKKLTLEFEHCPMLGPQFISIFECTCIPVEWDLSMLPDETFGARFCNAIADRWSIQNRANV